jgi:hypothetical protein
MPEIIPNIPESSKPLCTAHVTWPGGTNAQIHATANRVLDALYDALPKDGEGELIAEADELYAKASAAVPDRMELHVDSVYVQYGRWKTSIEAFYFVCHGCGYVLPAARPAGD